MPKSCIHTQSCMHGSEGEREGREERRKGGGSREGEERNRVGVTVEFGRLSVD